MRSNNREEDSSSSSSQSSGVAGVAVAVSGDCSEVVLDENSPSTTKMKPDESCVRSNDHPTSIIAAVTSTAGGTEFDFDANTTAAAASNIIPSSLSSAKGEMMCGIINIIERRRRRSLLSSKKRQRCRCDDDDAKNDNTIFITADRNRASTITVPISLLFSGEGALVVSSRKEESKDGGNNERLVVVEPVGLVEATAAAAAATAAASIASTTTTTTILPSTTRVVATEGRLLVMEPEEGLAAAAATAGTANASIASTNATTTILPSTRVVDIIASDIAVPISLSEGTVLLSSRKEEESNNDGDDDDDSEPLLMVESEALVVAVADASATANASITSTTATTILPSTNRVFVTEEGRGDVELTPPAAAAASGSSSSSISSSSLCAEYGSKEEEEESIAIVHDGGNNKNWTFNIEDLPDDALSMILIMVGVGKYAMIAPVSKKFAEVYKQTFSINNTDDNDEDEESINNNGNGNDHRCHHPPNTSTYVGNMYESLSLTNEYFSVHTPQRKDIRQAALKAVSFNKPDVLNYVMSHKPTQPSQGAWNSDYVPWVYDPFRPWWDFPSISLCLQDIITEAANKSGRPKISILKLAHQKTKRHSHVLYRWKDLFYDAISKRQLDDVLWLVNEIRDAPYFMNMLCDICVPLAREGDWECIKFFIDQGCSLDERVAISAASSGHLNVLQQCLLVENGRRCFQCITALVADSAVSGGHLHVFQWLVHNGYPWKEKRCRRVAQKNGHTEIVNFIDNL